MLNYLITKLKFPGIISETKERFNILKVKVKYNFRVIHFELVI